MPKVLPTSSYRPGHRLFTLAAALTLIGGSFSSNRAQAESIFGGPSGGISLILRDDPVSGNSFQGPGYGSLENGSIYLLNGGMIRSGTVLAGVEVGTQILLTGVFSPSAPSTMQVRGDFLAGINASANVTIMNGARINVTGSMLLGVNEGGTGILNIGSPAGSPPSAPGILSAAQVHGGPGSATLQFNHTATNGAPYYFTNTGTSAGSGIPITGSTQVVLNGGVTIFTANSSYTGGTVLSGGTLIINNHSGSATGYGDVQVNHGHLKVNGIIGGDVSITGGLLSGNGVIGGNVVVNNGTVAPGNSIGTLSIGGDYRQNRSSTLQIEVGSVNHHDVLIIGGTARLSGTLEILSLGYDPQFGDQIAFLVADKIVGRFDTIEVPFADQFRARFVDADGVGILLVAPASYTLVARTPNQENVAEALDEWIGIEEGDIGEVTLALDLLTEDQYPAAFEAIMPGYYEAALSIGIELSQGHSQLIHQYLSARRLTDRSPGTANVPSASSSSSSSAKGGKSTKQVIDPISPDYSEDYRWSAWTQGSGLFSSGGLSLIPGEDFESGTFLAGADYLLADHFAIGLFASYQEGLGDYDNAGDIDIESVRFGGYASFNLDAFYANIVIGGGQTGFDVTRPIQWATLNRTASSEPDGYEFFSSLGTGYDLKAGNWTFGPQATVQYSKLSLGEFNETGANVLSLRVHEAEAESLRSYLGGRIAYTIEVSKTFAIIPEVRAFWQHEFLDGDTIDASLDSGFGGNFTYETAGADEDSVFLGAGLGFQVGTRFYGNIYYNADLGRYDEDNHTVSVSATVRF